MLQVQMQGCLRTNRSTHKVIRKATNKATYEGLCIVCSGIVCVWASVFRGIECLWASDCCCTRCRIACDISLLLCKQMGLGLYVIVRVSSTKFGASVNSSASKQRSESQPSVSASLEDMTLRGGYKLEMTLEQQKQALCFLENEFLCDVKQHRASSVNTWRTFAFNHHRLVTLATVGFQPHQ